MRVENETAKGMKAVRLDSFNDIPGELVRADDVTGEVTTKDQTGALRSVTLGQHAIRIIPAKNHI